MIKIDCGSNGPFSKIGNSGPPHNVDEYDFSPSVTRGARGTNTDHLLASA